ncbi:MAG: 3-oxoacyl-ACP synthase III [Myxococcota bacterium]
MVFDNVSIAGLGCLDAPHRITSLQLEDRLASTLRRLKMPGKILTALTGIEVRRFWDEGVQPSEVASKAAVRAIEDSGIDRSRLGALINTSVCRDFIEPSTACLVHGSLGLSPTCINFDLGNACLGFINGMDLIGNMIERGQIDCGIVVDGESSRPVVDRTIERLLRPDADGDTFRSSLATLTLGSGAAAMVLARSDLVPNGHRYLGGVSLAATEHRDLCRGQVDMMTTDAKALLDAGIALARKTWALAQEKLGWSSDSLDEAVMHQVSKIHSELVARACNIDLGKVFNIYPEYGNVGPASVPIVLHKSHQAGRIKKGDRVALMGIGSGLNCSMAEIVW